MTRALLQQALEALEQRCGTQAEERQPGGLIDRLRDAVDAQDATLASALPAITCKYSGTAPLAGTAQSRKTENDT